MSHKFHGPDPDGLFTIQGLTPITFILEE